MGDLTNTAKPANLDDLNAVPPDQYPTVDAVWEVKHPFDPANPRDDEERQLALRIAANRETDASKMVPPQMLALRQWVVWKYVEPDPNPTPNPNKLPHGDTKPPFSPLDGKLTSVAIPKRKKNESEEDWQVRVDAVKARWTDYATARAAVAKYGMSGVGFVFLAENGFIGVDFDHCTKYGVIHEQVVLWIAKWFGATYAEHSVSGQGVHAICMGRLAKAITATPLPGAPGVDCEMYFAGRYFTFSGQRISVGLNVTDCQTSVDKLAGLLGKSGDSAPIDSATPPGGHPMSKLTARKIHQDNLALFRSMTQPGDPQNDALNASAFFAARAFAAGVLDGTEEEIQNELRKIANSTGFCPGVEATLRSGWSKGMNQPLEILEPDWPEVAEAVEELNDKGFFYVENYGTKVRVCWSERDSTTKGESYILIAQSLADFIDRFRDHKIVAGEKDNGKPILKNKAVAWLDSKHKRKFYKVTFEPGVTTPINIKNLWTKFAYPPVQGDSEAPARQCLPEGREEVP
jgi:hypothetical protein